MDLSTKLCELREQFLNDYKGKIDRSVYHADDVERVHKQDALLRNVLNSGLVGGDVQKGVALLDEILMFRMEKKLNEIMESDLHPELRERCYLYYKGRDKKGNKILQLKPCRAGNMKKLLEERKQLLLFRLFQHYRDNPEHPCVLLIDTYGASPANMSIDLGKYMMKISFHMFPCMVDAVYMFKMKPPIIAIYKILNRFKDSKDLTKEIFVKRSNIQEYIDVSDLEPHMIQKAKQK